MKPTSWIKPGETGCLAVVAFRVYKSDSVFKKMREFLEKFYLEPDKILQTESLVSDDEDDVL